jgi:tetratricopeptide (TPR) repeat protein
MLGKETPRAGDSMAQVSSLAVARFMRLARRSADVWQGHLARAPLVVTNPDGSASRPWAAMWVSLETGLVNAELGERRDWTLALDALIGLGQRFAKTRPSAIEVIDEELGRELARALGDPELEVRVVDDVPIARDRLKEMAEATHDGPLPPDALDAPGVTIARMRAFAEAARAFHEAAPWRLLSDEDLIHVEALPADKGLGYVTVLGGAGQTFGLGFFATPKSFDRLQSGADPTRAVDHGGAWAMLYGSFDEMPFGDGDLWEEHALPVAGPAAYPVAMRYGAGGLVRPDARRLAQIEAVLLALAGSSEDEIDQGRWSRDVVTADGPCTVTLAIPELLLPLDAPPSRAGGGAMDRRMVERTLVEAQRFAASGSFSTEAELQAALQLRFSGPVDEIPSLAATPLERAQDLAYRAVEASGRRRIQMARKALELSPDCADAHVLLAEEARSVEEARDHYARGVDAGERALGPETFAAEAGRFWDVLAARPYMRARFGLARSIEQLGRIDEAVEGYRELLRLDARDALDARSPLLAALLGAGRDEEAAALLAQFEDDPFAIWKYGHALCAFRREGDAPEARRRLGAAVQANPRAVAYLVGKRSWSGPPLGSYALGSEEEAAVVEEALGALWRATPGAERWLAQHAPARKSRKRAR